MHCLQYIDFSQCHSQELTIESEFSRAESVDI